MAVHSDVLIVEDDPDMADALLRVLRYSGYSARAAENGLVALEAVEARMPAMILLDILMPVMNGWDCARELRARYGRRIPIVIVTAAEHVSDRCSEIAADYVLPKPFELHELLEVVRRYADGGRLNASG